MLTARTGLSNMLAAESKHAHITNAYKNKIKRLISKTTTKSMVKNNSITTIAGVAIKNLIASFVCTLTFLYIKLFIQFIMRWTSFF